MSSSGVLLLAAADHNIPVLQSLLKSNSPNIEDPETLQTPLHAAIASLENIDPHLKEGKIEDAGRTLDLLLENGAIWNSLNKENETPGCVAYRLGLDKLYDMMVMAGVRAEMLLSRLDGFGWERLSDGYSDDGVDAEELKNGDSQGIVVNDSALSEAAVHAAHQRVQEVEEIQEHNEALKSDVYLSSAVTFAGNRLLDSNQNAVMMSWETDVMRKTAKLLLPDDVQPPRAVLNIGFGMGIIDSAFQSLQPRPDIHYIVEAHESVIEKMKSDGWFDKEGVVVLQGRWQDVLPQLMADKPELAFNAIYYDTFAETYSDLKEFFSEYVIGLLAPEDGRFSFFNGLGADRRICYDVYTKVSELDLGDAGLDVEWTSIPIPKLGDEKEGEWEGVKRRYWVLDEYRLPICKFA